MHTLFIGHDKPGALAVRMDNRPAHLAFLAENAAAIKIAGPYLDEVSGEPRGSMLIVEAESLDAAKALLAKDPYAVAGLFGASRSGRGAGPSACRLERSGLVIPAQAGIQWPRNRQADHNRRTVSKRQWIPACAGMTSLNGRDDGCCAIRYNHTIAPTFSGPTHGALAL